MPAPAPAKPAPSLFGRLRRAYGSCELLLRAFEQPLLAVPARVVDDLVQETREHASELGPFAVAERQKVVAVHGEIGEPVRVRRLLLEQLGETQGSRQLRVVDVLRLQVGPLVRDEVAGELVAVVAQEAPREQGVDVVRLERMRAYELDDVAAQARGIPKPLENAVRDPRSFSSMFANVDVRLAEVVEQRCEPHRKRLRRTLNDGEGVLLGRAALPDVLLVIADRGGELRDHGEKHAGIAGEPEGLGGP